MLHTLSRAEWAYLGRGAAGMLVLVALAVAAWLGPWSPAGSSEASKVWRRAMEASMQAETADESLALFHELVECHPDFDKTPQAYARMATLHAELGHEPLLAAEAWTSAARLGNDGHAWVRAGEAYAEAGQPALAERAYTQATEVPEYAVKARLALGRLRLATDPARAYGHYETALRAGAEDEDARLARLGMATALENLDRSEQALAELDQAALDGEDDDALRRRRDRLRQHAR